MNWNDLKVFIAIAESGSLAGAARTRGQNHRAERALMRLRAFEWLEKHHGDRIVARANDLSAMAALAKAGVGVALLPSDQREGGLKRLYRVPGLTGELWLLTHPDLRHVQRIRAVWDALIDAIGEA